MTKEKLKIGFLLILLAAEFSSCANLKSVTDYSSSSLKGIKTFEDINYSYTQDCIEKCQFDAISNFDIQGKIKCNCDIFKKDDSVTLLIYNSIKGYFDGLSNLSNNDLTNYKFDTLNKALTEGTFGDIKIDSTEVEAYSAISKILIKAISDIYRKNKIKKYVEEANAPIQILLPKFQFIMQTNLETYLNYRKGYLYKYYKDMKMYNTLSDYEKGKATIDYYQQLADINTKLQQIDVFAKGLKSIAEGHQKLYDNINKMSAKEMREMMTGYASNIQDIITEFNKLKK